MWSTNLFSCIIKNMNKKGPLFLCLACFAFLLCSCVSFSNSDLSSGIQRNSSDESESETIDVNYFDGDSFEDIEYINKKTLTFKSSFNEGKYISTNEELLSIIDNNEVEINYLSSSYVSQGYDGLKIGLKNDKTFGRLSFEINERISALRIYTVPRNVSILDFNTGEAKDEIDKNTALKVNEKDFIKIKVDENQTIANLSETVCSFAFSSSTNIFNIYSYGGRAVIKKIEFLYR